MSTIRRRTDLCALIIKLVITRFLIEMNILTAKYEGQKKMANDELERLQARKQQILGDKLLKLAAEEKRSMAQQSQLRANILEVKVNLEEVFASIDSSRQSVAIEEAKINNLEKKLLEHLKKKEETNSIAVASRRNWLETKRWLEERVGDTKLN